MQYCRRQPVQVAEKMKRKASTDGSEEEFVEGLDVRFSIALHYPLISDPISCASSTTAITHCTATIPTRVAVPHAIPSRHLPITRYPPIRILTHRQPSIHPLVYRIIT